MSPPLQAIEESNWDLQHTVSFDAYFAVGFPHELAPATASPTGRTAVRAAAVPLDRVSLHELPDGSPLPSHPLFTAKVVAGVPLESVRGMSGGPIIGARSDADGVRYWVVALQRSWFQSARLVTGSLVTEFAPDLLRAIKDAKAAILAEKEAASS